MGHRKSYRTRSCDKRPSGSRAQRKGPALRGREAHRTLEKNLARGFAAIAACARPRFGRTRKAGDRIRIAPEWLARDALGTPRRAIAPQTPRGPTPDKSDSCDRAGRRLDRRRIKQKVTTPWPPPYPTGCITNRIWRGPQGTCYKYKAAKNGKLGRKTARNRSTTGYHGAGSISRGRFRPPGITAFSSSRNSRLDPRPLNRHRPRARHHRLLVPARESRRHQHGAAAFRPGAHLHQQIRLSIRAHPTRRRRGLLVSAGPLEVLHQARHRIARRNGGDPSRRSLRQR